MASGVVSSGRGEIVHSSPYDEEATQIVRRDRVAESYLFTSFGSTIPFSLYQPMTITNGVISAGVLVQDRIVYLRETYCNAISISSANLNIGGLGPILVRLLLKRDQKSPLGSDVIIGLDQGAGYNQSIVIPLFCNIFGVCVHGFDDGAGGMGKATTVIFV